MRLSWPVARTRVRVGAETQDEKTRDEKIRERKNSGLAQEGYFISEPELRITFIRELVAGAGKVADAAADTDPEP